MVKGAEMVWVLLTQRPNLVFRDLFLRVLESRTELELSLETQQQSLVKDGNKRCLAIVVTSSQPVSVLFRHGYMKVFMVYGSPHQMPKF
jgi:hypothetical protein